MRLHRKILILLAAAALMVSLAVSPGQTGVALAQDAATVTYNLYATDGYVTLADGTVTYIYGFVGGRTDRSLTFQTSTAKSRLAVAWISISSMRSSLVWGHCTGVQMPGSLSTFIVSGSMMDGMCYSFVLISRRVRVLPRMAYASVGR